MTDSMGTHFFLLLLSLTFNCEARRLRLSAFTASMPTKAIDGRDTSSPLSRTLSCCSFPFAEGRAGGSKMNAVRAG